MTIPRHPKFMSKQDLLVLDLLAGSSAPEGMLFVVEDATYVGYGYPSGLQDGDRIALVRWDSSQRWTSLCPAPFPFGRCVKDPSDGHEHARGGHAHITIEGLHFGGLLPGEIAGSKEKVRYVCFLCEITFDIFSVNMMDEWCVCHGCRNRVVKEACKKKENV